MKEIKEISLFRAIRKLKKLNKEIKKNKKLETYFTQWIEKQTSTKNNEEIFIALQRNPHLIIEMVTHYNTIKDKF